MKQFLLFLFSILLFYNGYAQPKTPEGFGLTSYRLNNDSLGEINFYVTKNGIENSKPLLILLDGSGHYPLYSLVKKEDGSQQISKTVPFRYNSLSEKYHVVLISKPGIPFMDSLNAESYSEFIRRYQPSEVYTENLSLEWRAAAASSVIDHLSNELQTNEQVIAIGYSEGGQVVPKLATINNKVTKIVTIVGGGLNQLYDFITAERLKAQKGIISADSAQAEIENLFSIFQDIYTHPQATDRFWLGHTYKRWASFSNDIPLDNMIALDIPILLIASGNDKNSPITGLDYVPLEFSRRNKNNLTYKVYPNCDHWFNNTKENINKMPEMMDYVIDWLGK
tara:strand:+ start:2915 stop:3925 length:1011 start_codon:yes stop_codon:yes gene_type:complete